MKMICGKYGSKPKASVTGKRSAMLFLSVMLFTSLSNIWPAYARNRCTVGMGKYQCECIQDMARSHGWRGQKQFQHSGNVWREGFFVNAYEYQCHKAIEWLSLNLPHHCEIYADWNRNTGSDAILMRMEYKEPTADFWVRCK